MTDTVIDVDVEAQRIITWVRFGVEKCLLEEAESESCILSRVYPGKGNGCKYSKQMENRKIYVSLAERGHFKQFIVAGV